MADRLRCRPGAHVTRELAEDLAARTKAAIDATAAVNGYPRDCVAADRERVESDLRAFHRAEGGLSGGRHRESGGSCGFCVYVSSATWPCPDAVRYAEARDDAWAGLVRTARLYGVEV